MLKDNLKRLLALFLSILMVLTNKPFVNNLIFADEIDIDLDEEEIINDFILGGNGGSDENGNNKIISATLEFENVSYYDVEARGVFYYTDDYFKKPSTTYDEHLSTMSIDLAITGAASSFKDYKDKYSNVKDIFAKLGFRNITPNEDFLKKPEANTMGAVCANKPIYIKNSSGNVEKYNLISIVPRSSSYELEWISNFDMGETGDHAGFTRSVDIVYDHFTTFYNDHKNDFGNIPVKLWIVGYSRGGAIANMLSARLTDEASSFNTNKNNIYCYSIGTAKGVHATEHTTPLDSYTNIHNIVSPSDMISLLSPMTFGFSRYGIDHNLPNYVSENWHDKTKASEAKQNNNSFKTKYAKMYEFLKKINPNYDTDITTFSMYKLEPITQNLEFMKYTKLGEEKFTPTSKENEYYKAYEFFTTFINDIFGDELMNCSYPGTNYGEIKGRSRYHTKYQDLVAFAVRNFYVDENSSTKIAKIVQNAKDNLFSFISLITLYNTFILNGQETLPDRNHYTTDEHPTSYSVYYNAYDQLLDAYKILFKDVFDETDYNFIISRADDITDLIMDLLLIDSRTNKFPKQSTIGSLISGMSISSSLHSSNCYISWLQTEDSYYEKPPVGTINIDGYKSFIFSDLSDTTIKIYDEFDKELGYYTIDSNNVIEESDGLHNSYINIVKAYNPVGLELRIPSNLMYDFEVISDNKTIDKIIFKEFFITDNGSYRNQLEKTNIILNENQSLYVECSIGGTTNVFSCYPYETATNYQKKNMKKGILDNVDILYGNDPYSFSEAPTFTMKNRNINGLSYGISKENIATDSEISNIAITSEMNVEEGTMEIATPSEIDTGSQAHSYESKESVERSEDVEPSKDVETSEDVGASDDVGTNSVSPETNIADDTIYIEEENIDPATPSEIDAGSQAHHYETEDNVGTSDDIEPSDDVGSNFVSPEEAESIEDVESSEDVGANYVSPEEAEPNDVGASSRARSEDEEESETTELVEPESENNISAFSNTDDDETLESTVLDTLDDTTEKTIPAIIESANDKYTINFTTNGLGNFYYFDGSDFVEGVSGDSYDVGTRIQIRAPLKYGKSPFYGWTLTNNDGKYLNADGVDTVRIFDESDSKNNAYEFTLKEYDINIKANYYNGPYYLNIKVNPLKGSMIPSDFPIKFDKVEDFENQKSNLSIEAISPYQFINWTDGKNKYDELNDYIWEYNDDITLEAVFTKPGGGGGGSGGGGGGGGGGVVPNSQALPINNVFPQVGYVVNNLIGNNIYNGVQSGKWVLDSSLNTFRYGINMTEEDIINNANAAYKIITIDGVNYLADGLYRLGKDGNYYLFDSLGNMQVGFKVLNGKTYYFEETGVNVGALVQGEKVINGIIYKFDANGEIIHPASGVYTVVEGVWKYYPDNDKWGYEVNGTFGDKINLKSGAFAIKDSDGSYKSYVFDEKGEIVNEIK